MWKLIVCLALVATFVTAAPVAQKRRSKQSMPPADRPLETKISRLAPTVLTANTARLSVGDREALQKIIAAAKLDRKSTRLNSSHSQISYAVFCLKKKKKN